jgi:hypothetical protein
MGEGNLKGIETRGFPSNINIKMGMNWTPIIILGVAGVAGAIWWLSTKKKGVVIWLEKAVIESLLVESTPSSAYWLPAMFTISNLQVESTPSSAYWLPAMHTVEGLAVGSTSSSAYWIWMMTVTGLTVNLAGNFYLTIGIDPAGIGFVERTYLGITRPDDYLYPSGSIVTIKAWPYNNTLWAFMYWLTPAGAEITLNPMDVQMNQNTTLTAHFHEIPGPPPPTGPVWPAPGVVGDGMVWFWIEFKDNSAAWFDQPTYIVIMRMNGDEVRMYYGPYPSGYTP